MYIWLIRVVVQQKLTYCKAINLQLKIFFKKTQIDYCGTGLPRTTQNPLHRMGSQVHSRIWQIIMTVVEAVVVILMGILVTAIAEFCVCVLSRSVVSDSLQPLTTAHQAPLSIGILQARMLEWIAMPSSRGSSQPGD